MIKLAVSGCQGRMGQSIAKLAFEQANIFQLTTLLEHKDHPKSNEQIYGVQISTNNFAIKGSDVLIEFTLPDGTIENLHAAVENNVRIVIGTTGFTPEQISEIKKASNQIPIVFASNMSIGVNILFKLIKITAKKIGPSTISIIETHHIHKKDKPSGTAKTMAQIAQDSSQTEIDSVESKREGEVIGDHEITFDTNEDVLKITHHAKDRSMFAKGALTAAQFLMDKTNGLYNMQDVLGL